ncbi:MAG: hypothetical protein ACOYU0_00450 [Nitrospirota bacterium]
MLNSHRLFYIGIVIFILAKLYLVIMSTAALNTTRLGDDSLVYLWKGALNSFGYEKSLPALKDILAQRCLNDNPSEKIELSRWNTALRTTGTITPVYDFITRISLSTGLSMKWAFALTEVSGIIAMAAGFSAFLYMVVGPAAAGLGLGLLAFAILPNQGIYAFIPSTFALSLSMLLWAYLIKTKYDARLLFVFIASVFISGIHPIAKVYLLMGIFIHAISFGTIKQVLIGRNILLYGGIGCAILIQSIIPLIFPNLEVPPSELLGKVASLDGFRLNLSAILPLIRDPFIRKNLLLVALFLIALLFYMEKIFSSNLILITLLIIIMMAISLFHYLPGYPAELFTRLMVPFAVIVAGIGSKFVLLQMKSSKYKRIKLLSLIIGYITTMVLWVGSYVFHVMNWRTEVIRDEPLKSQHQRLSENTNILYVETDIALQASLLQGGYKFGVVAYPMIKNTISLDYILNKKKPEVMVMPNFRSLNSLSTNRIKNFKLRRHGFNFEATDYIVIESQEGKTMSSLYLFINNLSDNAILTMQVFSINHGTGFSESKISVQPNFKGWLKVLDHPEGVKTVRIVLPEQNGWVEGVATEPPSAHIYWPWKSGAAIKYHMRNKPVHKVLEIQFTLERLLSEYDAVELGSVISEPVFVISDDSGLVFFRTIYYR